MGVRDNERRLYLNGTKMTAMLGLPGINCIKYYLLVFYAEVNRSACLSRCYCWHEQILSQNNLKLMIDKEQPGEHNSIRKFTKSEL